MIFLYKTFKYKHFKNTKLIYAIKIFNDFLFFSFLLKEYIKSHNLSSLELLKKVIYLINILAVKYILYNTYDNLFTTKIDIYIYYKIYTLELSYWKNRNFLIYNNKNIHTIEQKILLIKKISRTREKGRIRRYKIIILIGNKSGWFGIGYNKNYHLQEAISKARLHAFKNVYQIPLFYSSLLKNNISIEKKSKKLYIFSSKYKIQRSAYYAIRVLFDFIGITNINSKIIGIHNLDNILNLLLNI